MVLGSQRGTIQLKSTTPGAAKACDPMSQVRSNSLVQCVTPVTRLRAQCAGSATSMQDAQLRSCGVQATHAPAPAARPAMRPGKAPQSRVPGIQAAFGAANKTTSGEMARCLLIPVRYTQLGRGPNRDGPRLNSRIISMKGARCITATVGQSGWLRRSPEY
jgi:hypothetical protein